MSMRSRRLAVPAFAAVVAVATAGVALAATTAASAAASGCRVNYAVTSQWSGGFTADVSVTNLGDPIDGWRLSWVFGSGQQVTQAWNASVTQSGSQVTAANLSWNSTLPSNGAAAFGFNGSWTSANPIPSSFALNGTTCTGTATGTPTAAPTTTAPPTPSPTASPSAALGNGAPTDRNIAFVGRWDTGNSAAYVPSWTGAYLETLFTGTTVRINQRDAVNLYASIDGGEYAFYAGVRGAVNLTPQPLARGTHRLRVNYRSGDTVFQGLVFDSGAGTLNPAVSAKLVEFVGDSITAGATSSKLAVTAYGWVLGEKLGVRHTQIARAGYCLVSQDGCIGQRDQFFKLGSTGSTNWDFTRYQAGAVVINLGTNDVGHSVTGAQFQSNYIAFLVDIRAKYPQAEIIVLETLKRRYLAETQAAVRTRNNAGDSRVRYVNTEGWLTVGTDYTDGDGHPNDAGHIKFANRLAPIIAPLIGVPTP